MSIRFRDAHPAPPSCGAARRSSVRSSPAHRARPRAPPGSRRARSRSSRNAGSMPAAAPGRRPRACRRATRVPRAERRWRWKSSAKRCASSRTRCSSCSPALCWSSRIGSGRPARNLLDPLRERDHRDTRQLVGLHRGERGRQLTFAAVDHNEVRRRREPLVVLPRPRAAAQPREPARDDLCHRGEVVLTVEAAHAELPVVRLLRHPVLEDDHRADDLLALDVRDVEALDPQRQALEVERLTQLLQRRNSPQSLLLRDEGLGLERELRVLRRQLREPPLLSPGGRANLDARAAQLGEELPRAPSSPRGLAGR